MPMWILAIFQFAIVTCLVTIFQGSLIPVSHGFISEATDKGLHSCEIRKSGGQLPDFWAIYLLLRDIDKVDELMADITEQQEVAQQISDAISRPVGFADDVDEVIGSEGSGSLGGSMGPSKKQCPRESGGKCRGEHGMFLEAKVSFLRLESCLSRMNCWKN